MVPLINSSHINLYSQLRGSIRSPEFWAYSAWLDIVTRYRRTGFGLLWILVPPVFYVGGIGFIYANLLHTSAAKFIPHLGLGYLLFRMFSNVITESAHVYSANQSFILDGHTRITDFNFKVIFKALFYFVSAAPVIFAVLWIAPNFSFVGLCLSLCGLFVVLLNLFWISTVIGLLGARFPDMYELMGSIFIFAFIVTPILWGAERAPIGTLHGSIVRVNPLFHFIEVVRAPLLGEPLDMTTPTYLLVMTVLGWLIAFAMYRRYSRFVPVWV